MRGPVQLLPANTYTADPAALLGRIECGAASVDEAVVFRLGASLTKQDTGIARHLHDAQVDGR